jgi:hypothetical protein
VRLRQLYPQMTQMTQIAMAGRTRRLRQQPRTPSACCWKHRRYLRHPRTMIDQRMLSLARGAADERFRLLTQP